MSDLVESEAEESLDEALSSEEEDDDEEGENEEGEDGNLADLINDDIEEEQGEGSVEEKSDTEKSGLDEDDEEERLKRKRRQEELDDEDLDLIQENLGIRLPKKKFHRLKKVKPLDSDEEEEDEVEPAVREREDIANQLFEDDDDEEMPARQTPEPVAQPVDSTYADIIDSEEEDEDDFDNFIVDDEGKPIKQARRKRVVIEGQHDSALQEAQDIFGLEFDFDEFDKFGQDDYDEEEDYEDEDDDDDEQAVMRRKSRKKATKKSIYEVFEPSELEKGMLTDKDTLIKNTDIPERFQLRGVPVKETDEGELEDEAEWIYKHAFLYLPISQQDVTEQGIHGNPPALKPHTAVGKIREALNLMRNQFFEVPFIANYRKEYVEPELNIDDLWKVFEWDEKWTQLRTRKQNLHRLFEQMQDYQFNKARDDSETPLADDVRILQPEDIDRLDQVQTMEQLKDVYSHFMLYYGNELPAMHEARKKKAKEEREQKRLENENEEEAVEPKIDYDEGPKLKKPMKKDLYSICRQSGLGTLAKKFGLTPDQFGENLRDNYQRHETEQHPLELAEAAEQFQTSMFATTDQVLEGTRHMVAMQIARDPLVRQCVRETYYKRATLSVSPTKKGKKEIDESHPCYTFKYLKQKPVRDLRGDQYLKLSMAEAEGLLNISISIDIANSTGMTYFDEVKQLYYRDEFSLLVQEWNGQRMQALSRAFYQMLYPALEKELKTKLLTESKNFVIKSCRNKLKSAIEVAPYQPEQQPDQEYEDMGGDGFRVLALSYLPDPTVPAFLAMLDGEGQVTDYLRLKSLLVRRNAYRQSEREAKEKDMESLKEFILKKRPQVIAVAAVSREATTIVEDIKLCLAELEQEHQMSPIGVELVDGEVARIYQTSIRADNESREYPPVLRHAVSVGRRLQDPVTEFAGLCIEEDELLCIKFHPLQDEVDKEQLIRALHEEFVTVVNDVGVDPNRLLDHAHVIPLLQFVCGLGPRKAAALLKCLRQQGSRLENRSQLVTLCNLGPKIFLNCAGFIKIDTQAISDTSTNYVEVLDGSRVHPETYEWAKQMAVDALEYDEATEENNPSAALEEILEAPDRLKDLDLDAFAEELERQNYGNKRITLYDIRDELFGRYAERRVPFRPLSVEDRFKVLTGETSETLYVGKMVMCTVTGFAFRKPSHDMVDQANPEKVEDTGLWQCPFCLKNDYPELSEVWTHLDNGSCPGNATGVRVRMENGISGFIPTKMISDKHIKSPQERVKPGMTLHCRVTRMNMERFQVDLSCRSSDLADKDKKFSLPFDLYYDKDAEEKDKKEDETAKKKANRPKYIKRVIVHPAFRNISFKEAERILSELDQGESIVRPSSKGSDHLTVTWKVDQGIYQHIDIREEGKENAFSLGHSLWIDTEEFEDLDEIIARHIQPMAALAREILNHKYYRAADGGSKAKLEELLVLEKKKAPQRIPYFLSASKEFPGKFLLGYLPRVKPRVEFVSICPEGFRYRGRVHGTLNALFKWFKEHFRDQIPGVTPRMRTTPVAMSESNTPYTPGATPLTSDMDANQLLMQLIGNRNIAPNPNMYASPSTRGDQQGSSYWGSQQTTSSTATPAGGQYPQYGYYQTHNDSISAAVQNYAYEKQQKQLQKQRQQQAYSS